MKMEIEFDVNKDEINVRKHGISLEIAKKFDFDGAFYFDDNRRNYGEIREIAIGKVNTRLHVMIFTRRGNKKRIISLRKANKREVTKYDRKRYV